MEAVGQAAESPDSVVLLVSPIAQVSYVFSEYSHATGSAMSTKIHAQARAHEALGGRTYVIVSDRRQHDYAEGTIVRYASSRSTKREWFTDRERTADAVSYTHLTLPTICTRKWLVRRAISWAAATR